MNSHRIPSGSLILVALAASTLSAQAHPGHETATSFAAGIMHPLLGVDHVAAMVTVGLWAAMVGGKRIWVWPLAFMTAMLGGGVLGVAGLPLPFVEPGIAASVVVLGLAIAFAFSVPVWTGALLVAVFAVLHGYAHGTELAGAQFSGFAAGFLMATGLLHLVGIMAGLGITKATARSQPLLRSLGALTAATGVYLFVS